MKEVIFVCSHRPKTKELLELFLFFLLFTIWFISSLKEIQVKKILPDQESNLGPSAPHLIHWATATELLKLWKVIYLT